MNKLQRKYPVTVLLLIQFFNILPSNNGLKWKHNKLWYNSHKELTFPIYRVRWSIKQAFFPVWLVTSPMIMISTIEYPIFSFLIFLPSSFPHFLLFIRPLSASSPHFFLSLFFSLPHSYPFSHLPLSCHLFPAFPVCFFSFLACPSLSSASELFTFSAVYSAHCWIK